MAEHSRHVSDEELIGLAWEELEAHTAETVRAHLGSCPQCGERFEHLRRVRHGLKFLAEERLETAGSVWPQVEVRLRSRRRRLWAVWPAAAAVLLGLWFAFRPGRNTSGADVPSRAEFAVLHAEVAGRAAHVFVFSPSDSVVTVWLQ